MTAAGRGALVAVTRRLDRAVDLAAVAGPSGVLFEQRGAGLAGRGVAARAATDDVEDVLASITCDDEVGLPGTGAVAFTSLPYRRDNWSAPDRFVIPSVIAGQTEDGARWITRIASEDAGSRNDEPVPAFHPVPVATGGAFTIRPAREPAAWCDAVAAATERIRSGGLHKVVLARQLHVEADRDLDTTAILNRLRSTFASSFVYAVDGYLGASPELLVSRMGDVVRSHPLAGTAPRTGDPVADAQLAASLLASAKNQIEHRITIDMVLDTLLPWCSYVDAEPEPSIVAVANVQHLGTLVEGRLSRPAPSVLTLAAALHPTPAVCGWPRDAADRVIDELEGFDRDRYAGAVGWLDARGNGRFAVAIRGAKVTGRNAVLYAGNGIVADSDPATELAETQAKLQAMLGAIVRP